MKDQHFPTIDDLIAEMKGKSIDEVIAEALSEPTANGRHLISVDELRAAGALDVPAGWRKSLGVERERDLFSGLSDDDARPEPPPTESDAQRDGSADELG